MKNSGLRFVCVALSVLLCAFLLSGCFIQDMQAKKHNAEGKRLLNSKRYVDALEQYRTIIFGYPNSKYAEESKKAAKKCEAELISAKYFQIAENLAKEANFAGAAAYMEDLGKNYSQASRALEAKKKAEEYTQEQEVKRLFYIGELFFDETYYSRAKTYYDRIVEEFPESFFRKDAELKAHETQDKIDYYKKRQAELKQKREAERKRQEKERERKKKLAAISKLGSKVK